MFSFSFGEQRFGRGANLRWIGAHQLVGPLGDGHEPFCILPQSQTGNTQDGGFFFGWRELPASAIRCFVRGWTGKMMGISNAIESIASSSFARFSGESTLDGLWSVRRAYFCHLPSSDNPSSSPMRDCSAFLRKHSRESIITFPTRKMLSQGRPSLSKLSTRLARSQRDNQPKHR
jgi:hypothetical protein